MNSLGIVGFVFSTSSVTRRSLRHRCHPFSLEGTQSSSYRIVLMMVQSTTAHALETCITMGLTGWYRLTFLCIGGLGCLECLIKCGRAQPNCPLTLRYSAMPRPWLDGQDASQTVPSSSLSRCWFIDIIPTLTEPRLYDGEQWVTHFWVIFFDQTSFMSYREVRA